MANDDAELPFLLVSAFTELVDAVHAGLAEQGFPGVTATHGFAMQAIAEGCSGTELGRRLGVSKQATAKTAAALEQMGFVHRRAGRPDGRERVIEPTARGRQMLDLSGDLFRDEIAIWRRRVGDAGVDATRETLASVSRGRRRSTRPTTFRLS